MITKDTTEEKVQRLDDLGNGKKILALHQQVRMLSPA
jgi:hypothetical protein